MTSKPLFAQLMMVVLAAGLSGCAERPAQQEAITFFSDPDADLGSVVGFVVDDEFVPKEGATVGFVGYSQSNVTTNAAGHFQILNVPPGSYRLHVVLTGYVGEVKPIDVSPGREIRAQLGVAPLSVNKEYHEIATYFGHIQCGIAVGFPNLNSLTYQYNFPCEDGDQASMRTSTDTFVGPLVDDMLDELVWTASSAGNADQLNLDIGFDFDDCDPDNPQCNGRVDYFDGQGPSPLVARVNKFQGVDRGALNETFPIFHRIFAPEPTDAPFVAIVISQPFTLYTSAFYGAPMPDGYSAMAGG